MHDTLCLNAVLSRVDLFAQSYCKTREGRPFDALYYQLPWLIDPKAAVVTGRDTGKSLVLTIRSAHHKVKHKGSSELLTSIDESRVRERFEETVAHFQIHSLLREYLKGARGDEGILRTPRFKFDSRNRHVLWGVIPGIVGNNYRQYHVDALTIEEASLFLNEDLTALWGAINEENANTTEVWAGTPDGRLNSPFWTICHESSRFKNHIYNVAKWARPSYTITQLRKDLENHGTGVDSNEFRQEVLGITGDPKASEFVPQDIRACMESGWLSAKHYKRLIVTREMWERAKDPGPILSALPEVPTNTEAVWQAWDIGTASKTIGGTFCRFENRWHLVHILEIRGVRQIEAQQDLMEFYRQHFGATKVGIDVTEGAGTALFQSLEKSNPVVGINFMFTVEVPSVDVSAKEGQRKFRVYEWGVKEISDMLARKEFGLPQDRSLFEEFTNFTIKKRGMFHAVAMFIVFAALKHFESNFVAVPQVDLGAPAIPSGFGSAISIGATLGPQT